MENVSELENAVIGGDLILIGDIQDEVTFSNIKVGGNLDLSGLETPITNLSGIEVDGDTIL
ncbi:hypothetical protein [Sporosarcina trichiuri]|uniref:hypothetical protein n=1 Tax=Sporosarcina trichiuri TaxID=3056445 RepID=UPI0025B2CCC8|nr:hypothetical protein [Sporosarcina sp. 0.2-SM1T-5]WJY26448.1 hypothetical protein QWT68_10185 [Sporosarcina sp. 0.2-SM1T-5]